MLVNTVKGTENADREPFADVIDKTNAWLVLPLQSDWVFPMEA